MEAELPPNELRVRVAGTDDEAWFLSSGLMAVEDFANALSLVGESLDRFRRVYEFGCGCGRVTFPLQRRIPGASITASDVDEDSIDWLSGRIPAVDVRLTEHLPPLPFADRSFDLVIGWSIFTHFPERHQDAWLAELARVTEPGGLVVQTVAGLTNFAQVSEATLKDWSHHKRLADPNAFGLDDVARILHTRGFVSWREADWHPWLPDIYQTTFHLPHYVRDHWSRWFRVLGVFEGRGRLTHDMVVLRRRGRWEHLACTKLHGLLPRPHVRRFLAGRSWR